MGFSTTCGDTYLIQTTLRKTKGDRREPAFDVEMLGLLPLKAIRGTGGFFLSTVFLS
jgi:hypothetical protein